MQLIVLDAQCNYNVGATQTTDRMHIFSETRVAARADSKMPIIHYIHD